MRHRVLVQPPSMEARRPARPVRPSALRAQQTFVTNGAAYHDSDADDDLENRPATRTSRRLTKVDLSKLDITSLQRYRKYYKIEGGGQGSTKDELLPSVARHFANQMVDEETVLLQFVVAVQRHSRQQQQMKAAVPMAKKPPVQALPLPPKGVIAKPRK